VRYGNSGRFGWPAEMHAATSKHPITICVMVQTENRVLKRGCVSVPLMIRPCVWERGERDGGQIAFFFFLLFPLLRAFSVIVNLVKKFSQTSEEELDPER